MMPAHTRTGQGIPALGSPEADERLEGAVGFQNQPPLDRSPDYSLHNRMRNLQAPNVIEDSENNNVDENSNDHQFPQYANYHEQFRRQQDVVEDRLPNLPNVSNAQEQAVRSRVYRRLPDFDHTDGNAGNVDPMRSGHEIRRHRRNHSEDLSISNPLPQLPPRYPPCSPHGGHYYDRWLTSLPRPQPSEEEVQNQAQELLYNFTIEEFREQRIATPEDLSITPGYSDPAWSVTGKELRHLADTFSKSQERNVVRMKAQSVQMNSLNIEDFFHLCGELFQGGGGITQERIVVLFTFISDVAIHHVRLKAERFLSQLMMWSLNFIKERICSWVQQAGGWSAVLCTSANIVYKWTMFTLAAVSIVALGVYIKKTLKDI